jgi:low molecular weight protein-tyrosine phosphatase
MSERHVLVVCTGNICRSALGGAFLREHLRERGLSHVRVSSAGTHAEVGRAALPAAVRAATAIRGDLSAHHATQLDLVTAREADLLLCAATEHKEHILGWWPDVPPDRVHLFNEAIAGSAPVDVDDPYGWDDEVFLLAARVIDRAMGAWAARCAKLWPA